MRFAIAILILMSIGPTVFSDVVEVTVDGQTKIQMDPEDLEEFLIIEAENQAMAEKLFIYEQQDIRAKKLHEQMKGIVADLDRENDSLRTQRNIILGVSGALIVFIVVDLLVGAF